MAAKDIATKEFESKNDVFADIYSHEQINGILYTTPRGICRRTKYPKYGY